ISVLTEGGLHGQIVVNGTNYGSPSTWDGPVYIDGSPSYTLGGDGSTAYYDYLSTDLGGGAVGLVPYHLDGPDCEPPHETQWCDTLPTHTWPDTTERETIVLRHYGPVFDSIPDTTLPLVIESQYQICEPPSCPPSWGFITSCCDVLVNPAGATDAQRPREIWVSRKLVGGVPQAFDYDYNYRISLHAPSTIVDLRCGSTFASGGSEPYVAGYPYTFNYGLCLDRNRSGTVDIEDVVLWIASPVDLNRDWNADIDDLLILIQAANAEE